MTCTFTSFTDYVKHCEAEKMCKARCKILALNANVRNAHKIKKLFKTNINKSTHIFHDCSIID